MVMMLVNIFQKEFHYQLMCTSFRAVMLPQDQLALGTCNLNLFTFVYNIIKRTQMVTTFCNLDGKVISTADGDPL
jgi:hypothetical protein